MANKFLDTLFRYKHLINPGATLVFDPKDIRSAPVGSLRLAKDPKTNLSLWNSIFVAGSMLPLAYLINTLSNKHYEAKIEDKLDSALVGKLSATRPRLVADSDLEDVSNLVDLPEKELKQIEAIKNSIKKKSSKGSLSDRSDSWLDELSTKFFSDLFKNALPMATVPAAMLAGIGLSNYLNKARIKDDLEERRIQLRNIQSKIDRAQLQQAGLVKSDSETELTKKASKDAMHPTSKQLASSPSIALIDSPALAWLIMSGVLAVGAHGLLKSRDKNVAKIDYLIKRQLGSNTLQDTPKIGVVDLPVKPSEILAVPGDYRQETYIDDDDDDDKTKGERKELPEKKAKMLENKELFEEVTPKYKEKDAIF